MITGDVPSNVLEKAFGARTTSMHEQNSDIDPLLEYAGWVYPGTAWIIAGLVTIYGAWWKSSDEAHRLPPAENDEVEDDESHVSTKRQVDVFHRGILSRMKVLYVKTPLISEYNEAA